MKRLCLSHKASVEAVTGVIAFFIVLGISALIYYNIMAAVEPSDTLESDLNTAAGLTEGHDAHNNTTYAGNSTGEILSQAETFYQVAPILAIVVIAVIIIAYVKKV